MAESIAYRDVLRSERLPTVVLRDDRYVSRYGFYIDESKISGYLLDEDKPHSKEFFEVGYTIDEANRLVEDIEREFKMENKCDEMITPYTKKFSLMMELGVTKKRRFRTVWQEFEPGEECRMVTAYLDRRVTHHG